MHPRISTRANDMIDPLDPSLYRTSCRRSGARSTVGSHIPSHPIPTGLQQREKLGETSLIVAVDRFAAHWARPPNQSMNSTTDTCMHAGLWVRSSRSLEAQLLDVNLRFLPSPSPPPDRSIHAYPRRDLCGATSTTSHAISVGKLQISMEIDGHLPITFCIYM